jgi:hypothetical protein
MRESSCQTCGNGLSGRQRRFCSRTCKNRDTNHRHQNYVAQGARGMQRKRSLVQRAGGRCIRCGYCRNLAALNWHHRVPSDKSFELDLRSLSNRSEAVIESELVKCDLLCANCHAEVHHPTLGTALVAD